MRVVLNLLSKGALMAKPTYSRSRSTKKSVSQSSRGRKSSSRHSSSTLTTDQKLNFIGGLLIIVGLLSFVALFARKNGALTNWVAITTAKIAGLGGFIIPVGLIVLGV